MRILLRLMALTLISLALMPTMAVQAGNDMATSILLYPGMTEFKVGGQDFVVVTTQRLRIDFTGANENRVWGVIVPLDGFSNDMVKFLWTSYGPDPVTLFFAPLAGRTCEFDSNDVTGHNEKFD